MSSLDSLTNRLKEEEEDSTNFQSTTRTINQFREEVGAPTTRKTISLVYNNNNESEESLRLHLAFSSKSLPSSNSISNKKRIDSMNSDINTTSRNRISRRSSNSFRRLSSLFRSSSNNSTNNISSSNALQRASSSSASTKRNSNATIISNFEPPRSNYYDHAQFDQSIGSFDGSGGTLNRSISSIESFGINLEGNSTISDKARRVLGIGVISSIGEAITTDYDYSNHPYSRSTTSTGFLRNRDLELQGEDIVRNDILSQVDNLYTASRISMDSIREVVDEEDEEDDVEDEDDDDEDLNEKPRSSTPASSTRTQSSEETVEAESTSTVYEEILKFYTPKSNFTGRDFPPSSPPPQMPLPPLPLSSTSPTSSKFIRPFTPENGLTSSPDPFSSFVLLPPSPPRFLVKQATNTTLPQLQPSPNPPSSSTTRALSPQPTSPVYSSTPQPTKPSTTSSGLVRSLSRNFLSRKMSKSDLIAQQLALSTTSQESSDNNDTREKIDKYYGTSSRRKIPLASIFVHSSLHPDPSNWVMSDLSSSGGTSSKWKPEVLRSEVSEDENMEVLNQETVKHLKRKAVKLSFLNDVEILVQDRRPPASLSICAFPSFESTKNEKEPMFYCVTLINWTNADSVDDSTELSPTRSKFDHDKGTTRSNYWIPHALTLISKFPFHNLLSDFLRLMWAKSQSFDRHAILMKTVLNQPSDIVGSKILLSVKADVGTSSKTFFVATMPRTVDSRMETPIINFSPWIVFNSLNAENIFKIIEVALSSKGKVIFTSDYSIMLGLSISTFELILKRRGWRGVVHSAVHARDLKLLLEDTESWIIAVSFTSLSPLLSTLSPAILIVNLDRNTVESQSSIQISSRFSAFEKEKAILRLKTVIGRSSSLNPFGVPEELKEAFPGGRFRPFSNVEIGGRLKEAEQISPPCSWKFDIDSILTELDSIFTIPLRPMSFISKIFGSRSSNISSLVESDSKEFECQEVIRNQIRELIERRDILETEFWNRIIPASNIVRRRSGTFSSIASSRITSDQSQRSHLVSELGILQEQRDLITQKISNVLQENTESIYKAVYSALESTSKSSFLQTVGLPRPDSAASNRRRTSSRSFQPNSAAAATEDFLEMLLIQEKAEEERGSLVRAVVGETLKSVQSRFNQVLEDDYTRSVSPYQYSPPPSASFEILHPTPTSPQLLKGTQSTPATPQTSSSKSTNDDTVQKESPVKGLEFNLGFVPKSFQLSAPSSPIRRSNTLKHIRSHSRNNSYTSFEGMKDLRSQPSLPILRERNSISSEGNLDERESRLSNYGLDVNDDENIESLGRSSVQLFTRRGSSKSRKEID